MKHRPRRAISQRRRINDSQVARKFLAEGSVIYLYHSKVLVAHSDRLEGYKQMPDGLVRVVGLKLK